MIHQTVRVREACEADMPHLATLFDLYRIFYKQPSDEEAARAFLSKRLARSESKIFVAERDGSLIGFVQLYPTFSSISLKNRWILNDLYVGEECRGERVGEKLIAAAIEFARTTGADALSLETARHNSSARSLYERMGWKVDDEYLSYCISC